MFPDTAGEVTVLPPEPFVFLSPAFLHSSHIQPSLALHSHWHLADACLSQEQGKAQSISVRAVFVTAENPLCVQTPERRCP